MGVLLSAGEKDHVSPPAAVRANFRKYRKSEPTTEYRELEGRSHFLAAQDGRGNLADLALAWSQEHAVVGKPPSVPDATVDLTKETLPSSG